MTADEYMEAWRGVFAIRDLWISDEFRRHGAEEWAALDRALGPCPTLDDLRALRMWRAAQEVFGSVTCNVPRRRRAQLTLVA